MALAADRDGVLIVDEPLQLGSELLVNVIRQPAGVKDEVLEGAQVRDVGRLPAKADAVLGDLEGNELGEVWRGPVPWRQAGPALKATHGAHGEFDCLGAERAGSDEVFLEQREEQFRVLDLCLRQNAATRPTSSLSDLTR